MRALRSYLSDRRRRVDGTSANSFQRAVFVTSASTSRLASSASSRHDNNPEVLQHEKARNLKGEQDSSAPHKDTAPGWNERLASCVALSPLCAHQTRSLNT